MSPTLCSRDKEDGLHTSLNKDQTSEKKKEKKSRHQIHVVDRDESKLKSVTYDLSTRGLVSSLDC